MGAKKFDKGKPPLSRIPYELLEDVAHTLEFGADKYGWHNWKEGMDWSRVLDASLRHINKFARGEDIDEESGLNHLGHAACNIAFLLYYLKNGVGNDDR